MSYRLGLTGSIGMGKSTAAAMFAEMGHPVWDADATVHRLYAPDGAAVEPVAAIFPMARAANGGIDRKVLRTELRRNPSGYEQLDAAVHPLLLAARERFVAENDRAPLVIFDIPLLLETGIQAQMDGVAVVSTNPEVQRARVLARPGMTPTQFEQILSRQMPDQAKRALADWVIPTDTMDASRTSIQSICKEILDDA